MTGSRALGQKAAYCFTKTQGNEVVGKAGNALVYKAS